MHQGTQKCTADKVPTLEKQINCQKGRDLAREEISLRVSSTFQATMASYRALFVAGDVLLRSTSPSKP